MSDQPIPPERPLFPPVNAAVPPPPRRPAPLSLPRRPAPTGHNPPAGGLISLAYADAPIDVQRKIEQRLNSRSPFPNAVVQSATASAAERARLLDLERNLRLREQEIDARERAMEDLQARLADREREIAELENLLLARERVLMAQRRAPTIPPFQANAEETAALEKLRAELDAQEDALAEAKAALKDREAFIEQSEITLLNKVAAQQEHEIMLEQRYEDLRRSEQDLRRRLAEIDPAAAAEIEAERIKQRDEFNE
jgi:chromosome segregation ATPase